MSKRPLAEVTNEQSAQRLRTYDDHDYDDDDDDDDDYDDAPTFTMDYEPRGQSSSDGDAARNLNADGRATSPAPPR